MFPPNRSLESFYCDRDERFDHLKHFDRWGHRHGPGSYELTAHIQKPIHTVSPRLLASSRSILGQGQGQASLTLGGSDDHTVGGNSGR